MITLIITTTHLHMYCFLHPYVVSYIIPYFMNNIFFIHKVNELFHMFKCTICIMKRFTWKMCVKINIHICLISYIGKIFIMILKNTDFYGESTVEVKRLWLNLRVKLCLQCFIIIRFLNNSVDVRKKNCLLNFLQLCFPSKHIDILTYEYL